MNLFHGGRLAAMPAKLLNDESDLFVLRPLAYCAEKIWAKFAALNAVSDHSVRFVRCSQDGLQRNAMKQMLTTMEAQMPGRKDRMLRHYPTSIPLICWTRSCLILRA